MDTILIDILNQFGYWGVLFLIAIENIFPPIPSEIILTFSGFMTLKTNMTPLLVIVFSTIGSLLGAIVLFYIGKWFNEEKIYSLLDTRIGKLLHFNKKHIHRTITWFHEKGKFATLFGRCIPIIRSLISIPAGMAEMKFSIFIIYTTIGSLLWNVILVSLGVVMGENWKQVIDVFNSYSNVVAIALIVLSVGYLIYHFTKKKRKR